MCCGSRRAAWRSGMTASPAPSAQTSPSPSSTPTPAPPPGPPQVQGGFATVVLRYDRSAEARLRGPITGRAYRFSGADPVQVVDARDAAIFVRNTAFRLA